MSILLPFALEEYNKHHIPTLRRDHGRIGHNAFHSFS